MATFVATAPPAIHASAHGCVTVRLCALRRADGSMQLACAQRDLVLLSGVFQTESELRHAVQRAGVPAALALASMFQREIELSQEQLQSLGFGKI